ncbi:M24 family metallopeptidase [Picrophilus oshimae]|uniref:Xaa-Pro dipeptidase n=1 Tax=Picrophilus torridus (strain ATCC 700027 / DSM 9790 / JCM 10055 / NBRC 100828 / KAW 2/3) TaxID=1122961 RepID=Q6L0D6_PICTO|nr:Xaa-Pro peptidase family protein [Picrophilus oshimae]AAT43566.1 Xaa-Pro dipeptidase [Picrophilus oshimae DSM 9789]
MDYKKIFDYTRRADAIIIFNGGEESIDKTFFYLTGARSGIFENSALIVTRDSIKIVTSKLEESAARETGIETLIFNKRSEMEDIIRNETKNFDSIGINYSSMTLSLYRDLMRMIPDKDFIDVSESILEARKIKEPEELEKIKNAAKIASDALQDAIKKIKEGITESELASEVAYSMMKLAATGPSFNTIVAFGKNSAIPHYSPGDKRLRPGDFVLIDYGALYNRYCSDVTRTMVFGRASQEQRDIYETVKEAQQKSMDAIKAGKNGRDIDAIARSIIDEKYPGKFIHSLGHGVGMDVHDHPALSPSYDFILKRNMVVTVEPGIYIPETGGVRIEDDVIVTDSGHTRITTAPRDLIEL